MVTLPDVAMGSSCRVSQEYRSIPRVSSRPIRQLQQWVKFLLLTGRHRPVQLQQGRGADPAVADARSGCCCSGCRSRGGQCRRLRRPIQHLRCRSRTWPGAALAATAVASGHRTRGRMRVVVSTCPDAADCNVTA